MRKVLSILMVGAVLALLIGAMPPIGLASDSLFDLRCPDPQPCEECSELNGCEHIVFDDGAWIGPWYFFCEDCVYEQVIVRYPMGHCADPPCPTYCEPYDCNLHYDMVDIRGLGTNTVSIHGIGWPVCSMDVFSEPNPPGNCSGYKCDGTMCIKGESPSPTITGNRNFEEAFIKASNDCFFFDSNGCDGCYCIDGIGTTRLQAWRMAPESPDCRDISHLEGILEGYTGIPEFDPWAIPWVAQPPKIPPILIPVPGLPAPNPIETPPVSLVR